MLAFAWTALLIELTPGPNMTYLALLSARRGVRIAAAAVAGVALGLALVGMASALGFAALVARWPWLYETIRWAGAFYLLWLAWEAWRGDDVDAGQHATSDNLARDAFRDGLVTNLLNPKAAVFYVSVLPVFTDPAKPFAAQALWLAVIYVAVATFVHAVIVVAADRAARLLARDDLRQRAGRLMAVVLAGVALWLLYTTRRGA